MIELLEMLASLVGIVVGAAIALKLIDRFPADTWLGGKLMITVLILGGALIPRLFF